MVHDPQSGETHYLNMMAMVALEMLEEGARSVDGLAQSMASYFEIVVDETLQGRASALVARFDELGLILPCRT